MTEPERCDRCGIRLAPADPHDPEDGGPRCSACVRAYGPAEPTLRQLELELEPVSEQLGAARCKEAGCTATTVGSSISGTGHVCARHNKIEWGRALAANPTGTTTSSVETFCEASGSGRERAQTRSDDTGQPARLTTRQRPTARRMGLFRQPREPRRGAAINNEGQRP